MPDTLNEGRSALEFLISEAEHGRSRDAVILLADEVVTPGMVLGRTVAGTAAAVAFAGNTGDGTMGAITVSGLAKDGAYSLVVIEPGSDVGDFEVRDPDGEFVGTGAVAAAFSAGGLAFTLADGSADYVAGDGFTITVTQTSKKFLPFDQDALTTGENIVAGIAIADGSTGAAVDGEIVAIVRSAQVQDALLVFPGDITGPERIDAIQALAALGIIART